MHITFQSFYEPCFTSEAWLTNILTKQSRIIILHYQGGQYMNQIKEYFRSRGFLIELR